MAVYNKSGGQITAVYRKNGGLLHQAYDLQGRPLMSGGGGTDLTLMTYNVGQWYTGSGQRMPSSAYEDYSELHRAIIEDNDPDIAVFEEYLDPVITGHSVDEMIGEYFEDSASGGTSEPYFIKSVWSKLSLGATTSHTHTVGANLGYAYLRSSVEVDGHTIHIFVVHFYNGTGSGDISNRAQHASELFSIVSQLDYFVVLGDFNLVCTSVNDPDYTNVMLPYVNMGCYCANCTEDAGFIKTWFPGSDFASGSSYAHDNIVTSPNIIINEVIRDEHKLPVCGALQTRIDHVPLIAKVTVY